MNEPFDPDATVSVWHADDDGKKPSPDEPPLAPVPGHRSASTTSDSSLPGYWQPKTRLSGRVSTPRTSQRSEERRAWWIAGIIIFVALLLAIALSLAALWIRSNDSDSNNNSGQESAAMTFIPS